MPHGLFSVVNILFFFFFTADSFAVPVIFRTNQSVLVRTPSGVQARPGIGKLLETVPSAGGAKAQGAFPVSLGKAEVPVPVSKSYLPVDIAAAAAQAIINKSALGLAATLALPYVIDEATGLFMKVIPGEQTQPEIQTVPGNTGMYCYATYGCRGTIIEAIALAGYTADKFCWLAPWNTYSTYNTYFTSVKNGLGNCGNNGTTTVYKNQCPAGSTFDSASISCKTAPSCTLPSTYDSATEMCIGSAINEPANAEQLASDIEDTFSDPIKPVTALDGSLDADVEPPNGQQEVDLPDPVTVPGETETSTRNYHDPATGHPVTEETTKQTDYKLEKTGANQLDVKPTVSTTINITDNVTNITTTTSHIAETSPSEATTEQPLQTDCDKYPDSVGCLELGDIAAPETLTTTPVDVSINPSSWGSGSCPADVSVAGHFITGAVFSYAPVCQFLTSLAPVLIAVGWLIAGWFVLGGVRD